MLLELQPPDFVKIIFCFLRILEPEVSDGQVNIAFKTLLRVVDEPKKGDLKVFYSLLVFAVLEEIFSVFRELEIKRINFLGLAGSLLERECGEEQAGRQKNREQKDNEVRRALGRKMKHHQFCRNRD